MSGGTINKVILVGNLGKDRSFEWNYNEAKSYITTTLKFNFQSGKNISHQYEKLRKNLNDNFRTYDINISSLPAAKEQNLSIDVEIGEAM